MCIHYLVPKYDLDPSDFFFLWGYIMNFVYAESPRYV
jgi:hypothetical protein